MDVDQLAAVPGTALWSVTALATVALVARVARRPAGRTVWAPATLAAAALCASHLPDALGGGTVGDTASLWLALLGTALLTVSLVALLRLHQRIALLRAWLDMVAGALILVSILIAVASEPLQQVTGLDGPAASLLLAGPGCAVLVALASLVGLRVAGALATGRARFFVGSLSVLAAAETAGVLERTGMLAADAPIGVHEVGVPLALVMLAASSWVPAALLVPADEPDRAVMIGPVVQLVDAGVILGVDHAIGLPTPAVVLALCVMAVQLVCVVLVHRLVSSLHGSHHQARTDELTGLGNRRALAAALTGAGSRSSLSLTLLDLDRFKEVNDVLGHESGDDLLRQVAERLLAGAETGEVVVRQGGDEFAVVRQGSDAEDAALRAAGIVTALEEPFTLGEHQVSIAASIGIAAAPQHATDAVELLRMADSAMYRAKEAGGGVVVYDGAIDAARRADLELVADLRVAVANDQLSVHFQPQLEAATGALVGVEALVRWQHPTRGMLAPFVFLPLAERNGLMEALTRQVLRRALAAKNLIDGGTGSRMSVNISATSLLDPHLVTTVGSLLQEHAVPPPELMLEITETELMLDATVSRRVVNELVGLGVGVSIDDYGTGHSSLSYLKDLPATELKLDRSFVAELGSDPRIATIVRSTVDLAHSLGLRLVAEGVEDEETLERLIALGVDVTQGYHHSRPVPAEELARWAAQRRIAAPAG